MHKVYMVRILLISTSLGILYQGTIVAQTNLETNAGIQFNFSAPGAANLAMGGAFLALADDATTAYTNPAGLTHIVRPEVHVETRGWRYTHVFTDHGRLEDRAPTGSGIDTYGNLQEGEAEDRVTGVSFLSYVYPARKWAIAFYRHELARFEANFSTQGAFLERTRSRSPLGGFPIFSDGRLASLHNTMTLDIVNHGVSASYRVTDHFAVGIGLSYHDFSLDSITQRFLPDLFALPTFQDEEFIDFQTQTGEDSDWGMVAGFLWKSPSQRWSVGGVYRQGPNFDFTARSASPKGAIWNIGDTAQPAWFHVPDVYGLGVAFQPTDAITISFDYDRVEYSDLTKDMVDIYNVREVFDFDPMLEDYSVDDASELHLGVECSLHRLSTPLILRFGMWHDPDHTLRFEGDNLGLQAVYRRRGDEMHFTAGIGLVRRKFQLDAAFDYSERVSIGSLSAVLRF